MKHIEKTLKAAKEKAFFMKSVVVRTMHPKGYALSWDCLETKC